jgi:hypothetical protein
MSPTNKTDRHDIIEILLKVALDTTKQINKQTNKNWFSKYFNSSISKFPGRLSDLLILGKISHNCVFLQSE